MFRRLLREPLFHFLVLGGLLFLAYSLLGRSQAQAPDAVVISEQRVEALAQNFAAVWMRAPTPGELKGVIDDYVSEELYYREALAIGLDKDDTIIRRRLRQKMEFIAESVADATPPTEAQLQEFVQLNAGKFAEPARTSLQQVFISPDRRGDALRTDAAQVLAALQSATSPADPATAGDPTLLPPAMARATPADLAGAYGESFAAAVGDLPLGQWAGPVASEYGLHLVKVDERVPGTAPAFDAIRPVALREWQAQQRQRQNDAALAALREKYQVRVEGPAATLFGTAAQDEGSAKP